MSAVLDAVEALPISTQTASINTQVNSTVFSSPEKEELARLRPAVSRATDRVRRVVDGDFNRGIANPRSRDDVLLPNTSTSEIAPHIRPLSFGPSTTPLQIWEGEVISVDEEHGQCRVKLVSKQGDIKDHVGTISMNWISAQDADLVKPGAMFYLTLYREVKRGGTVANSQELRFRRLPSWTRDQLEELQKDVNGVIAQLDLKPQE